MLKLLLNLLLSQMQKCTPPQILLKIYRSCIQPANEYALTIWGNTMTGNLKKNQEMKKTIQLG